MRKQQPQLLYPLQYDRLTGFSYQFSLTSSLQDYILVFLVARFLWLDGSEVL